MKMDFEELLRMVKEDLFEFDAEADIAHQEQLRNEGAVIGDLGGGFGEVKGYLGEIDVRSVDSKIESLMTICETLKAQHYVLADRIKLIENYLKGAGK